MTIPLDVYVRGRCTCGRRYRIRNPQPGAVVACPSCARPIQITAGDLRAALQGESLLPLQSESVTPLEAVLIDHGELRLAPAGSRPGVTGRRLVDNSESLLSNAMRGWLPPATAYGSGPSAPATVRVPVQRTFVDDLFASFYFAGERNNAANVLLTAIACALPMFLHFVMPGPFLAVVALLMLVVIGYAIQFYWSVLRMTAAGEDEIPWVQSDLSLWDDCVLPIAWMACISLQCSLPAILASYFLPPALAGKSALLLGLLALGWLFWPIAVMSVSLGNTLLFVRPDWLVRCLIGIGPVYLIAVLVVLVTLAGWAFFVFGIEFTVTRVSALTGWTGGVAKTAMLIVVPVLSSAFNLYAGYVLFRTMGLLFRHFRERLPWRF